MKSPFVVIVTLTRNGHRLGVGTSRAEPGRKMGTVKSDVDKSAATRRGGLQNGLGREAWTAVLAGVGSRISPAATVVDSASERWSGFRLSVSWLEGLALAVALLVVLGFVHPMAATSPTLRAVVETVMTLLALAAAALAREQFAYTRRLRMLMLLGALLMLALVEFFGYTLPAALDARSGNGFTAALPIGHLIAGAMLALTALTPSDRLIAGRSRPLAITAALSVVGFGLAEGGGLLLPSQLVAGARGSGLGLHLALRQPLGFTMLIATVALLALAAVEFARCARLEGNGVFSLLAGGAILLAGARLYSLTLPWISPQAISVREGLRLLAFGMLFAALLRRDLESRASVARAAAIAERHRVAQDLHDGLAQDLAFIAAHGVRFAEELGGEHPLAVAAKRALAVSRNAISELSDVSSTSPREALEAIALELSDRFGIGIAVDVHAGVAPAPDARNHIARIAREAIANAARHGGAQHIVVSLKHTSQGLALRVSDDGCGIHGESGPAREGFGIRSMRDRAAALGGSLMMRPRGGRGTELEVILP
jgi:signal transduction histidine kinase